MAGNLKGKVVVQHADKNWSQGYLKKWKYKRQSYVTNISDVKDVDDYISLSQLLEEVPKAEKIKDKILRRTGLKKIFFFCPREDDNTDDVTTNNDDFNEVVIDTSEEWNTGLPTAKVTSSSDPCEGCIRVKCEGRGLRITYCAQKIITGEKSPTGELCKSCLKTCKNLYVSKCNRYEGNAA